jgi:hypothetical protein
LNAAPIDQHSFAQISRERRDAGTQTARGPRTEYLFNNFIARALQRVLLSLSSSEMIIPRV